MKTKFNEIIVDLIVPFLERNGFTQKEFYFHKTEGDFIFNFNFAEIEQTETNYNCLLQCCIYFKHFNEILELQQEDYPKAYSNFFYKTQDEIYPNLAEISIATETDHKVLGTEIITALQKALDLFSAVSDKNTLIDLCFSNDLLTNFENRFKYFIACNDAFYIEKYATLILENVKNDASQKTFFEKELLRVANIGSWNEKFAANFPKQFKISDAFQQVCDWAQNNQRATICGLFEFDGNGKETIKHWIDDEEVANRFAVFGQTADLDMFCIWQRDDGSMPVVRIGGGGSTDVLTATIDDFIDLLAINYYEVEGDDLSIEPIWADDETKASFENAEFRKFYTAAFKKEIPATAKNIIAKVQNREELYDWLCKNYQPWTEF
jgi:hypothetical protein